MRRGRRARCQGEDRPWATAHTVRDRESWPADGSDGDVVDADGVVVVRHALVDGADVEVGEIEATWVGDPMSLEPRVAVARGLIDDVAAVDGNAQAALDVEVHGADVEEGAAVFFDGEELAPVAVEAHLSTRAAREAIEDLVTARLRGRHDGHLQASAGEREPALGGGGGGALALVADARVDLERTIHDRARGAGVDVAAVPGVEVDVAGAVVEVLHEPRPTG